MTDRPGLRHIVFFSAKDKADVPHIVAGLRMLADSPYPTTFEVCENGRHDTLSDEVDVVVYAEFDSADDLAAYKADPLYQAAIDVVRPLRALRIAADI